MGWLFRLISGGVIGQIGEQINKWQEISLQSKNASERIEADRAIAALQARKDVLVAESRDNIALRIRVLARMFFGLPLGIFIWKVVVWDKVLGLGVTDGLDTQMWNLMYMVYGFYFASEIAYFMKRKV